MKGFGWYFRLQVSDNVSTLSTAEWPFSDIKTVVFRHDKSFGILDRTT
jgi:hypothetical protein